MSASVWTFIDVKNETTGKWEPVNLYYKDGNDFKRVDPEFIGNGAHSFIEYLFDDSPAAHRNFPPATDLSEEMAKFFYEKDDMNTTFFNWGRAIWFDYNELGLLAKTDEACITNYEADPVICNSDDDEDGYMKYPKHNFVKDLYDQIRTTMHLSDPFFYNDSVVPGTIRVIVAYCR